MNRILTTSITTAFAAAMMAGSALAMDPKGAKHDSSDAKAIDMETQTNAVDSTQPMMMGTADISAWQTGDYRVQRVSTLEDGAQKSQLMDMAENADNADVKAVQASIQSNPALLSKLEADNVQVENIIAAAKALDGSVTFYVR